MKPKVLYYCQHLIGIGHLVRSLAIARELARSSRITFLQGGPPTGHSLNHPGFSLISLAPLLWEAKEKRLYDPCGLSSADEILAARNRQLDDITSAEGFDAVIVEHFPFGRRMLAPEILKVISRVKQKNPQAKVISSVRDIVVSSAKDEADIVRDLNDSIDLVLVHTDPNVVLLEDSFPLLKGVKAKVVSTGYVGPQNPLQNISGRSQSVVVSNGGGSFGHELMLSVARAAAQLPDLNFSFYCGPFSQEDFKAKLRLELKNLKNASIERFSTSFDRVLANAGLSISLGGYNTVMEIVGANVPALVYPYSGDREQGMRVRAMEQAGRLRVLAPEDLATPNLVPIIQQSMTSTSAARPRTSVNFNGAARSAQLIVEFARSNSMAEIGPTL